MSQPDVQPLPNHRACEELTGITLQHIGPDYNIGRRRSFRKGMTIWVPTDPADRIYFLEQGSVGIIASDAEGREFTMRLIQPGQPFGELCFCSVTDSRRHCSSRALSNSSTVEIGYDDLYTFLQQNRPALMALTYTFCVRLSEAEERLDALTHRGAEARLGRLLISLATADAAHAAAAQVVLRASHNHLAQMAAMNRSHVTVTLGKFREKGLVEYRRGYPLRVNVQKLMVYLQSAKHQQ